MKQLRGMGSRKLYTKDGDGFTPFWEIGLFFSESDSRLSAQGKEIKKHSFSNVYFSVDRDQLETLIELLTQRKDEID